MPSSATKIFNFISFSSQAGLHIQGVGRGDEGEYSCQVTTVGGVEEVSHWLSVRVPPSIRAVPPGGAVTGREGTPVTLRCDASGVPPPIIQWHKSVGTVPGGEIGCQGGCFTITELTRSGTLGESLETTPVSPLTSWAQLEDSLKCTVDLTRSHFYPRPHDPTISSSGGEWSPIPLSPSSPCSTERLVRLSG